MVFLRRHIRFLASAWIVFQAASLSALVPRACCLAHQTSLATPSTDCHDKAPAPHCSTPADDMTCAMHHRHTVPPDGTEQNDRKPAHECAIRGTCDGPIAALLTIFATHGVLTNSFEALPDLRSTTTARSATDQLIGLFVPPDAPPPRA
jgi:hypothetical protein